MTQLSTFFIALCSFFLITGSAAASNDLTSIEFFASNTTQKIDSQTAYRRLQGKEQRELQRNMLDLLQKRHLEQGAFEEILGEYKSSADNTEKFTTSPYQKLSEQAAFELAKILAQQLKQESVGVFIPQRQMRAASTVEFGSQQPPIQEVISTIREKLPASYSQAYSLHLANRCGEFGQARVREIEWLGNKIKLEEIKVAFPGGKITEHSGKAYLVYANGEQEEL